MPVVELIYDIDCPNISRARENLLRAFQRVGLKPTWREWDRADAAAPAYVRLYGSPTLLVDGKDVAGTGPADAACCRIYTGSGGSRLGAPPVELIAAALGMQSRYGATKRNFLALLPSVGTALMPKLVCPACWPAYAGVLSALGIGFINYSPYLLPLTMVFLAMVLVSLAWRARGRRGHGPLALGALATAIILAGKFRFDSDDATYVGVALLVGASLWNSWPRRTRTASCYGCLSDSGKSMVKPDGGVS